MSNKNGLFFDIRDLDFMYDEGTTALEGINIGIKGGEFVGILASNGGGKTTLLKAMMGLLKRYKGEIFVNGSELNKMPEQELYQQLGMVFQNPNDQLFAATVEEDVAFGPLNLGLSKDEVALRVEEALQLVGIEGCAKKPIHHLSFGQMKRAAIAGVLAMKPKALILDEPTAGLDPEGESSLMHLLGKLNREEGITIIMATHMIDLLPLFLDRVYMLDKGRLVIGGTPEEAFSQPEMLTKIRLRLPYITHLIEELRRKDGVPLNGLPLTVGEARRRLVEVMAK
ncbi:MAG: ATP-binding cassette domain-containing protein [Candidatus Omnitrophica bacterium]|nr:ATP-binding cassette domain-containing protein [Candidatus Omnitrophota bacterium]